MRRIVVLFALAAFVVGGVISNAELMITAGVTGKRTKK